jgi:hypothetical protein
VEDKMTGSNEIEATNQDQELVSTPPSRRIGGFLIFVVVVMILNLIRNSLYFLASLSFVLRRAQWEYFTNPESAHYHPFWKTNLILDAASNAVIVGLSFMTIFAFFRKKRTFPFLAIITTITIFLLALIGHYFDGLIPAVTITADYAKEGSNMIFRALSLGICMVLPKV